MSMPASSSSGYRWLVNRIPAGLRPAATRTLKQARDRCADNRRRVLAHKDIAACLTESPLDYPTPEMWSGYIPPATVSGFLSDEENNSPRRVALMQIMWAVDEAERNAANAHPVNQA